MCPNRSSEVSFIYTAHFTWQAWTRRASEYKHELVVDWLHTWENGNHDTNTQDEKVLSIKFKIIIKKEGNDNKTIKTDKKLMKMFLADF